MKITLTQLRRIIKEEIGAADERSVLGKRGEKYNDAVARMVADDWAQRTRKDVWLSLAADPAFKSAVNAWAEANAGTIDNALPLVQLYLEDAECIITRAAEGAGGGSRLKIELTGPDGLLSTYSPSSGWTVGG